eukprot:m.300350 g.300350  ORF g.300350 m.300350 type:complete len:384 (-) comp27250_c2_seq5:6164-7315(-)
MVAYRTKQMHDQTRIRKQTKKASRIKGKWCTYKPCMVTFETTISTRGNTPAYLFFSLVHISTRPLREGVVVVSTILTKVFHRRKIEKVGRAVGLVIKLFRWGELQIVQHRRRMLDSHEVVVPRPLKRCHEKSEELVRQEHLNLFVVRRGVPLWVGGRVLVVLAPIKPTGGQLVCCERARSGRERTRNDRSLVERPRLVVGHDLGVGGNVLRCQLWQLVWLRVDPSKRLVLFEDVRIWQQIWKIHSLVRPVLWHHHNRPNLLHLRVVLGAHSIEVARDLGPQIRDHDKLLEDVLREDVRVPRLLDVVTRDINVLGPEVEISSRDGSHPPLGLGRENGTLVVRCGVGNHLVTVHVGGGCGSGGQLRLLLGLLLDFGDLLTLLRRC